MLKIKNNKNQLILKIYKISGINFINITLKPLYNPVITLFTIQSIFFYSLKKKYIVDLKIFYR